MPEDSKKTHEKKKHDPKEQRKPRQRHQQAAADKKSERKPEEQKNVPKVTAPQKPVYESPPPEFFKNLKRETDEILKITEEENTKYKKKEILSNWSKYEMPIDSYEEIEEHENLGVDYEKLIQAPLSIGGHFQFKHEKSWDMNSSPSLYDKYFDINMEDLNIAICTIPFHGRNSIEESNFSQTDLLTMNNRATRFKQKYYNDKSYSTPETEALDRIINNMKDEKSEKDTETSHDIEIKCDTANTPVSAMDINLEIKSETKIDSAIIDSNITDENNSKTESLKNNTDSMTEPDLIKEVHNIENDDFIFRENKIQNEPEVNKIEISNEVDKSVCYTKEESPVDTKLSPAISLEEPNIGTTKDVPVMPKVAATMSTDTEKNPVIESPEDLEKWLDDFLDG